LRVEGGRGRVGGRGREEGGKRARERERAREGRRERKRERERGQEVYYVLALARPVRVEGWSVSARPVGHAPKKDPKNRMHAQHRMQCQFG